VIDQRGRVFNIGEPAKDTIRWPIQPNGWETTVFLDDSRDVTGEGEVGIGDSSFIKLIRKQRYWFVVRDETGTIRKISRVDCDDQGEITVIHTQSHERYSDALPEFLKELVFAVNAG
jgi:hypothetical protein